MKKVLSIIILTIIYGVAYAQTSVVVNGDQTVAQVEDKSYYINGISSKEDIGGITTETLYTDTFQGRTIEKGDYARNYANYDYGILVITNLNPVPVSVNWETYETRSGYDDVQQSGSITLKPNERREVCHTRYRLYKIQQVKTITRKLAGRDVNVVEEMKKYKELLDAGILTQEEFDAKKKEILGL